MTSRNQLLEERLGRLDEASTAEFALRCAERVAPVAAAWGTEAMVARLQGILGAPAESSDVDDDMALVGPHADDSKNADYFAALAFSVSVDAHMAATGRGLDSSVSAAEGAQGVAGSLDWLMRHPEPDAVTVGDEAVGPIEAAELAAQDAWLVALETGSEDARADATAASSSVVEAVGVGVAEVGPRFASP